jgi:RNA polymerase sigma-70 factor, ECF subfamily
MLQSRASAEDQVQALFVDLLEKGEEPDLAYLYRAITNRCLTLMRDEGNRARLLAAHDVALRGPARTRCDEHVIGLDLLAKLTRTLDDETLELLVYRYLDDMSQEEIAQMTGVSRKTVGKRLDRARAAVLSLTNGEEGRP